MNAAGVDLQGTTASINADAWPKGLNRELRRLAEEEGVTEFVIENPRSRHNLAVGQTADVTIRFRGSVGNYCGGLNSGATIHVERNVGWAADTFQISVAAPGGWGASVMPGQVVLAPRARVALTITIAVPTGAPLNSQGRLTVQAVGRTSAATALIVVDVGEP